MTEVHLVPLVRGLVDKYLLILLSFYTCAQHTQPISLGTVVDDIHNFKALWRWWSWGGNSINTNYKFAPTTLHPPVHVLTPDPSRRMFSDPYLHKHPQIRLVDLGLCSIVAFCERCQCVVKIHGGTIWLKLQPTGPELEG